MNPRIAFVAVDLRWEDQSGDFAPFSYAAYKLEASIRSCPELAGVETRVFDIPSRDPEVFLQQLRAYRPTLVAASTYIWSTATFVRLAKLLQAELPEVRFVMGGPSARESVLELAPYRDDMRAIDAVVTGEGEEVMRLLATAHLSPDWTREVPGLLVRGPLGWRQTGPLDRPELDRYATPYHTGTAPPGKMGFIETFRGCPIQCAFCQWGEQRSDRVHSEEYLTDTLRELDASGVTDVLCLDAAFNLSGRAFRNLLAAEKRVGALGRRRLQGHLYPILLKDEHVEFIDMVGDFRGSIGIQSLDPEVLARLGRPFDQERFEAAIRKMRNHMSIDAEFIMGLPGDNPRSFRETFRRSVEMCDTVRVFWCLALPDALLKRIDEFDIEFDPVSFKVSSCTGWTLDDMRREWDYMIEYGSKCRNLGVGESWLGFATTTAGPATSTDAKIGPHGVSSPTWTPPAEALHRMRQRLTGLAGWQITGMRRDQKSMLMDLQSPDGGVVLELEPARAGRRSFRALGGVAYSHRGSVSRETAGDLLRLIELVHPEAEPLVLASQV